MLLHPIFNHCAIFPLPKVWRKADEDGRQIDKSGKSSKRSAPGRRYSKSSFQGIRSQSCVNCRHVSTIPLHSANFLATHVIAFGELFGLIRKIEVEPCRFVSLADSEILHQLICTISGIPLFIGFQMSQTVQDIFHQQYGLIFHLVVSWSQLWLYGCLMDGCNFHQHHRKEKEEIL